MYNCSTRCRNLRLEQNGTEHERSSDPHGCGCERVRSHRRAAGRPSSWLAVGAAGSTRCGQNANPEVPAGGEVNFGTAGSALLQRPRQLYMYNCRSPSDEKAGSFGRCKASNADCSAAFSSWAGSLPRPGMQSRVSQSRVCISGLKQSLKAEGIPIANRQGRALNLECLIRPTPTRCVVHVQPSVRGGSPRGSQRSIAPISGRATLRRAPKASRTIGQGTKRRYDRRRQGRCNQSYGGKSWRLRCSESPPSEASILVEGVRTQTRWGQMNVAMPWLSVDIPEIWDGDRKTTPRRGHRDRADFASATFLVLRTAMLERSPTMSGQLYIHNRSELCAGGG